MKVRGAVLATLLCHATVIWDVRGAEILSKDDAEILHALKPASRAALPGWLDAHDTLVAEVAAARDAGGVDFILYGDSIQEAFRGTSVGMPYEEKYGQNRATYSKLMANRRSLVLGISGDQAMHLLWRLQNGEGPKGLNAKVITIMIGTNDVGHLTSIYGDDDEQVARIISLAVQQCVRELQLQAPQATIVVFGLLPLQLMMPKRPPQRTFDSKIAAINERLRLFATQQASGKLRYKDCGAGFLDNTGAIKAELMSDGIHPTGKGAEVLLTCMLAAIQA